MKMKRSIFVTVMVVMFSFVLVGCSGEEKENIQVDAPKDAKELKNENYEDVQRLFKKAGFENILIKEEADLKLGLFAKEGDVDSVSIDGDTKFKEGDSFDKTAEVVITYHVFPQEDSSSTNSKDESSSSSIEKANGSTSTSSTTKETVPSSSKEVKKEEKTDNEIITAGNNSEFANILTNEGDREGFINFGNKYKGRKVEFDGNIAYMSLHGNNKTRYDFLITSGDYDPNSAKGVDFQIENKNVVSDLHLTGDNIPDSISEGLNIHLIATIDEYDEKADLMMITPVETRIR